MIHYLHILTTTHLTLPYVLPGIWKVYWFDLIDVVFESKFVVVFLCCCFSLMDVGCGRSRFRTLPVLPSVWPHPAPRSLWSRPPEGEHATANTQATKTDKNKHETSTNTRQQQTLKQQSVVSRITTSSRLQWSPTWRTRSRWDEELEVTRGIRKFDERQGMYAVLVTFVKYFIELWILILTATLLHLLHNTF